MRRAFTLIELLIVIAIIAILALIAVPNFLEAQTRAKVSRARADMRSLSVALEAYAVDWGIVPPGSAAYRILTNATQGFTSSEKALSCLSTPVAYITNPLLKDPFAEATGHVKSGGGTVQYFFRNYKYQSYVSQMTTNPDRTVYTRGYHFLLTSYGPTRDKRDPVSGFDLSGSELLAGKKPPYIYDSSNGTMSFGFIIRTNKGELDGAMYEES